MNSDFDLKVNAIMRNRFEAELLLNLYYDGQKKIEHLQRQLWELERKYYKDQSLEAEK